MGAALPVLTTVAQVAVAAGTTYAALKKPKGGKAPGLPDSGENARRAREAADRRRRSALASQGHAGNVLTGPSGVSGGTSKVLGG